MKLKNNFELQEVKRHLSTNIVKVAIILNLVLSIVYAIIAKPPTGFTIYYFDEILYHYLNYGLMFLIFTCLYISLKIMLETKKNYSLISRFYNKKELVKKILIINSITVAVVVFTCYMGNFLAYNIFSITSLEIVNLRNYNSFGLTYLDNLPYVLFFLIRTLILLVIISGFNIILIYFLKKTKVLFINLLMFYYLFIFDGVFNWDNMVKKIDVGFLDLKRYFRYPLYDKFQIELINSILIILVLSVGLYLFTNIVNRVKTIDQKEV